MAEKKLRLIGDLINNAYARVRNAFVERKVEGYQHLAQLQAKLGVELVERAGLSALSVINAATGNSSNQLGYKEKFGPIKPGYRSRFIITKHSPLEKIANLKKFKYVIYDGARYDSDVNIDATGL